MNKPVRISLVSYLNSRPFLFGLRHADFQEPVDIQLDIPSVCADKLLRDEVDIGLVPVAILPSLPGHHILSDYCIGARGPVRSVLLVSDVPLQEIRTIMLDYHSRTSVTLVKILAESYWKIAPQWEKAEAGFESRIAGDRAAVIIGDRAFQAAREHAHCYDLAEAWTRMTGKPFVFAVWASRKPLAPAFLDQFNRALGYGLSQLDAVVQDEKSAVLSSGELKDYLTNSIRFDFDEAARAGLEEFLLRMRSGVIA